MTMTDTERRDAAKRVILDHTRDIEVTSIWDMLDGELPEDEMQADIAVEAIDDLIRAATVTVTFPGPCGHEYERPDGRQPGDRIVACDRPAGHRGEHRETDTGHTWPAEPEPEPFDPATMCHPDASIGGGPDGCPQIEPCKLRCHTRYLDGQDQPNDSWADAERAEWLAEQPAGGE